MQADSLGYLSLTSLDLTNCYKHVSDVGVQANVLGMQVSPVSTCILHTCEKMSDVRVQDKLEDQLTTKFGGKIDASPLSPPRPTQHPPPIVRAVWSVLTALQCFPVVLLKMQQQCGAYVLNGEFLALSFRQFSL